MSQPRRRALRTLREWPPRGAAQRTPTVGLSDGARPRWVLSSLLAAALLTAPAHAQFNPQGRRKPPSSASPAAPRPKPPTSRPSAPSTGSPGQGTARPPAPSNEPSTAELIDRYTQVVLSQPGSEFPLRRLAELARKRDGNLEILLNEFEERARQGGAGQYNALVALAGLYERAGRFEEAASTYDRAAQLQPRGTLAPIARARLLERGGDPAGARTLYEGVLPRLKGNERELVLRDLVRLCLDLKDFAGAKRHHGELVRHASGSMYVRAELGRELLQRGEVRHAVVELRDVVKAARGDDRALAPALRDLGAALLAAGESREAMDVLRQARRAASGQPGLQREIDELLVTAHRREGKLPELIAEFERSSAGAFDRLRILGRLYEETGDVDKALGAYRRALQVKPQDVETRLEIVQLLELQGELDQAIVEYEQLVKKNPGEAALVFRFAETLLQRGERTRALGHLQRLQRTAKGDEDTLVALTDFYERVGETELARQVLTQLSGTALKDPRHLVELGSRHWRDGKRDEAKRTWSRILTAQPDRARALVTLGEVYLDHDLVSDALKALREAVSLRPQDTRIKRSLAIALERVGAAATPRERNAHWEEARALWSELLDQASREDTAAARALTRESRQHIVKLWQRMGELRARLSPLASRLHATPPDLDAGRLLAEGQLHLRQYAEAEKTLRVIVKHAPGDVPSLLALERSLIARDRREQAIEVLQKLIAADPQRARDYYQRSARYAAELYQDERAIEFAVRAVELSPDDAEGHLRLGEMYRRRQATQQAISSYRQAIGKNDRLYPAYFDLAELLVSEGQVEEADRWLRRVVRTAPDDELVARAARLSLQLNLSRGSLAELEADLLPLALSRPDKPLYRRLLIEVYSTQAFPLVHRASSPERSEREAAIEQLARLGERAVKPLLDALGDERPEQQRTALELLTHVRARGAAPALLAYAGGDAPQELRERAVIAAGAARDERSLPKLEVLLFGEERGGGAAPGRVNVDPVAIAAAWAIARLEGRRADAARARLMATNVPELRTLGVIGAVHGARAGTSPKQGLVNELRRIAGSAEAGPWPRAAAAYGLGLLDRPSAPSSTAPSTTERSGARGLMGLLDHPDPLVRAHALGALAALRDPGIEPFLAEALTSSDSTLRAAALRAAAVYATPATNRTNAAPLDDLPEGPIDVRVLLESLLPPEPSPAEAARALIRLAPALEEACLLAIRSSGERAVVVAQALTARGGEPAFGALTAALDDASPRSAEPRSAELAPATRDAVESAARSITEHVAPAFEALLDHDSVEVRSASVAVLGLLPNDAAARRAVLRALHDPTPAVQNAALAALGRSSHDEAGRELTRILLEGGDWRLRRGAARALDQWLQGAPSERPAAEALAALRRAAAGDAMTVVRQAARATLEHQETRPSAARLDPAESSPVE